MDTVSNVLSWLDNRSIVSLGSVSSDVALFVLQCLQQYRVRAWTVMYPIYLHARFAAHPCAHDILSTLWFAPFLSRACRSCGKQTQRCIFGTLLCASCTRNSAKKCWMIPESAAIELYGVHVPTHKGPRCPLVFASHVEIAASWKLHPHKICRKTLVYHFNAAKTCRQ